MVSLLRSAWVAAAVLLLARPGAAEPQLAWEATGLSNPESVVYDPGAELIYVSNVNGRLGEKDGNGFIAKLDLGGRPVAPAWVSGLDAPTGMALANGALYVADIDRLVTVDVATGEIVASHAAAGARLLNDVAADPQARVFVGDTGTGRIWSLDGEQFQPWLDGPALQAPNGLLAETARLVVACFGRPGQDRAPGRLRTVDLATKAVADLGPVLGNLDGIVSDGGDGYLVTEWSEGALLHVAADGRARRLLTLEPGAGDLGIIPEQRLVLIPLMEDNKVAAYRLD